jgi:hypothetical protein
MFECWVGRSAVFGRLLLGLVVLFEVLGRSEVALREVDVCAFAGRSFVFWRDDDLVFDWVDGATAFGRDVAVFGRSVRLPRAAFVFELAAFAFCPPEVGAVTRPAWVARTTPGPLNTAGFDVAATTGLPWFTDANCDRSARASCSWRCCTLVTWT